LGSQVQETWDFTQVLTCRLVASYWPPGDNSWPALLWECLVQWLRERL